MAFKYKRDFRFVIAKLVAFLVGTVAWLLAFVHTEYDGFHSLFTVSKLISVVSSGYSTYLVSSIMSCLIVYGGLIIGLSFLRGKARSVTSIIFASFLLIDAASVALIIYAAGKSAFSVISNGFGVYVFMFCCVMIIVFSAIDLATMSKEKKMWMNNNYGGNNNLGWGTDGNFSNINQGSNINIDSYKDDKLTITDQKGSMTCVGGEYVNFTFPLNNGDILTIGKDPKSCAIVITQNNQYVSSVHCSVKFISGRYEIFDGSKNGVKINGSAIPKQQWVAIAAGSVFSLANTNNLFRVE